MIGLLAGSTEADVEAIPAGWGKSQDPTPLGSVGREAKVVELSRGVMANTISASNRLHKTYSPAQLAQVRDTRTKADRKCHHSGPKSVTVRQLTS